MTVCFQYIKLSLRQISARKKRRQMGNCINHGTTASWEEKEDWLWEEYNSSSNNKNMVGKIVAKEPSSVVNSAEVKIKITKKQFEELLLPLDDEYKSNLLAHLISDADSSNIGHIQWRPTLQGIAEGVEV